MTTYEKNPDAIARLSPEQYRVTQQNGTESPEAANISTIKNRVSMWTLCPASHCLRRGRLVSATLFSAETSPANITTSATRAVGVVTTMVWHAPSRSRPNCFRDARMDEPVTIWFG